MKTYARCGILSSALLVSLVGLHCGQGLSSNASQDLDEAQGPSSSPTEAHRNAGLPSLDVSAPTAPTAASPASVLPALPSLTQTRAFAAEARALVAKLSLDEKTGQMLQAEFLNLQEAGFRKVREHNLGSVLSGGNSTPADNSPAGWQKVVDALQMEARASSSGLPILYGIDAVHGNAIVGGATVFPHNMGLGATFDPDLIERIAMATAEEVAATGVDWAFSPSVAVVRDMRWGRSYESFGESSELQTLLAGPAVRGLQAPLLGAPRVLGCAKHFLGDGGTTWGTGEERVRMPGWIKTNERQLDRGDTRLSLDELKALHGEGYRQAIAAGIPTIMASFNSVNGTKMAESKALITDYLKAPQNQGGLGFEGFVISDWNSPTLLPTAGLRDPRAVYKSQLIRAVLAGLDMFMIEGKLGRAYRFEVAHEILKEAVIEGRIPMARIDDAVTRILTVKLRTGLLDRVLPNGNFNDDALAARATLSSRFGNLEHRTLAREAVRKSLVLLKNEGQVLPLRQETVDTVCIAGKNAHNVGAQEGAWTLSWQGQDGNKLRTPGDHSIYEGLKLQAEARGMSVHFADNGAFGRECSSPKAVAIAVIGEKPYAEFLGDAQDLSLDRLDRVTLRNVQGLGVPVVTVVVSGRPIMVSNHLPQWKALVAAWLPGSQGEGVADVLFGDHDFQGRLPVRWPAHMGQYPSRDDAAEAPLFPYGFGLSFKGAAKN